MIVLDTDHLSFLQHPESPEAEILSLRLQQSVDREIVTTAVSVEEQLRSWLGLLNRYRDFRQQTEYYERLIRFVRFFNAWTILGFDDASGIEFQRLRQFGVRIGTSDLKIASVALVRGATLLTRNRADFECVPGLKLEDWTIPSEAP